MNKINKLHFHTTNLGLIFGHLLAGIFPFPENTTETKDIILSPFVISAVIGLITLVIVVALYKENTHLSR